MGINKINGLTRRIDSILRHWIGAGAMLLVIACLGLSQIDLYPPRTDEFYSMVNVGWIVDGPYSPLDVLSSLRRISPDHTPLYFLLLNAWGHLVGADVALGRVLSVYAGLLAAAMIYRLTRDNVSPIAGLFAGIILASNAVHNFYLWYMRMYPLLLLTSAIVCWLYLRLARRGRSASRREFIALFAACYALANTHAISALLFAALGIYHVLHVKKDRRWLNVTLTVIASMALFSPWAFALLSEGLSQTFSRNPPGIANTLDVLASWLSILFAGSIILPILLVLSLAFQTRALVRTCGQVFLILMYFTAAQVLFTQFVGIIVPGTLRLTTPGWALFLLAAACIHFQLYRSQRWLGALVLLWAPAGLAFQQSGEWTQYLSISGRYTELIPWHAVSRAVAGSEQPGGIVGYEFDDFRLNWPAKIDYPQNEFYFARHGISIEPVADAAEFDRSMRNRAISEPNVWVMARRGLLDTAEASTIAAVMAATHYQACAVHELGLDTVLTLYGWQTLDCRSPDLAAAYESELIRYEFFGARVDASGDSLLIVDQWAPRRDFVHDDFNLSHQLISAEWDNVASLDLPLSHRQALGQFAIDISDIAPGNYTLVAITYDKRSGKRIDWLDNPGAVPALQTLTEITIPEA